MEFVFYAIGVTMAILGAVVWMLYQQMESVDQFAAQQNNALKKQIYNLQSEVDFLRKKLDALESDNEENEDE